MDEWELLRAVADDLDAAVLGATRDIKRQPAERARERYLDLLTGLVHATDAARALADGECAVFQDRAAACVRNTDLAFPQGPPGPSRRAG